MPDNILSRACRISDPKMAAALTDPLRRRLVLVLAQRERSLGELSDLMQMEIKRLHYHVTALRKLGLIVVTGKRARAGRAMKLYRAIADAFYVPAEFAGASPGEALATELREAQLVDRAHEGILYRLGENGTLLMQPIKDTTRTSTADCWRVIRLSHAEALRLAADMEALLQSAAGRSRGTAKPYLVHFAFAPRRKF